MCIKSGSGTGSQPSQITFMNAFQHQVAMQHNATKDFVTCPMGVLLLLTTLFGSGAVRKSTATQIAKTLDLRSPYKIDKLDEAKKEAKELYRGLHDELTTELTYFGHDQNNRVPVMMVNNGVFVKKGYRVHANFLWSVQNEYDAAYQELDFNNQSESARSINSWVNSKTRGIIPHFFQNPAELPRGTRVAIFNAFTFKDGWLKPFQAFSTRPEAFHSSDEKVTQIPMMSDTQILPYVNIPEMGFALLRKPLRNYRYSFIIALPSTKWDMSGVDKLLNMEYSMKDLIKRQEDRGVSVKLPRFKIESSLNLIPTLKAMGVQDLFKRTEADMSGITTEERLYIDIFKQNSVLKVDESGVEAAAATGVIAVPTSMIQTEVKFHVNHPFVCFIYDEQMNVPLFAARVTQPRE